MASSTWLAVLVFKRPGCGPSGAAARSVRPYRAQTKGKVERFIGYLKGSFWVPFVASMRQAGLKRRRPISKEPGVQVAGRFQPGRGV